MRKSTFNRQISIMLTSKQRAALEILAEKSELTLGNVARRLIDRGLERLEA